MSLDPGAPQGAFDFSACASDDATRSYTILYVESNERFKPGFADWLRANWPIWARFRREADKIRARGRPHYAARTIAEYLRHETMLREAADAEFKLNNNNVPDLARLYMALESRAEGFFELRGRE